MLGQVRQPCLELQRKVPGGWRSVLLSETFKLGANQRSSTSLAIKFVLLSALSGKVIRSLFTDYTPTSVHLQNNNSALSYSDFVVSAILTELLKVGSVVECPFPPVVVNPLSVSVQSNRKKRRIRSQACQFLC